MALEPLRKGSELLHKLLAEYLADRIDTPLFCSNFEHAWNFDVALGDLAPAEYETFSRLFDQVAYFSPEPPGTWEYPGYRTAEQIREAAIKAAAELRKS